MTTDLLHTGAGGRTNLTAISLYIGSAVEDVLSVSCSCRALRWGVSPGSSVNVCTLTSVSLLSLCSSEAYYHEVLWMLCIREVAHKRMIRESFQTQVVCTDRLFVEQNGNTAQGWGGLWGGGGGVHLLNVPVETQALTLGIMYLIIYVWLSANNSYTSHRSTFCHLWKSQRETLGSFGETSRVSSEFCLNVSLLLVLI